MDLLSMLVYVKIQSDVIFSEIFKSHKGRCHVQIGLVKDHYFPAWLFILLTKHFFEQIFLYFH